LWVVFFAVNLALFAGACLFWSRLATGQWLALNPAGWGADVLAPVAQALAMPLGAVHTPWMIPVYGLLTSVFVFVPITVAGIYRLAAATVFVLCLALLGHGIVLALGVMLGCMVVAFSRYKGYGLAAGTALGLPAPILLLMLIAYAGIDATVVQPIGRWIPVSWLVLGSAGALAAGMVVVSIAWLAKVRKGVILSLQALFLLAAGLFFQYRVGMDRLDFALLQKQIPSPETIFVGESVEPWLDQAEAENPQRMNLGQVIRRQKGKELQRKIEQAQAFLRDHPGSVHVPQALWLLTRMHSLVLSEDALDNGHVTFSTDWPSPEAAPALKRLVEDHPAEAQSYLARLRLAELALRDRRPQEAYQLLKQALPLLEEHVNAQSPDQAQEKGLFLPPRPVPPEQVYAKALQKVRLLLWLIEQNQVLEEASAAATMAAYMNLNPHSRDFGYQLRQLIRRGGRDPDATDPGQTPLADNLELALALSYSDNVLRARRLLELADGLTDAAIQANYELGRLVLQARGLQQRIGELESPEYYFRLVSREAPVNPWQEAAERHLKWLEQQERRQNP
jgi:hypothetical protein